jgi:hypothetical protein
MGNAQRYATSDSWPKRSNRVRGIIDSSNENAPEIKKASKKANKSAARASDSVLVTVIAVSNLRHAATETTETIAEKTESTLKSAGGP